MPVRADQTDRRREIVAAATALVSEKSVQKLSLRGVAARLGGSVTLITHYYGSRDELLDDVSRHLAGCWEAQALTVRLNASDPASRLLEVLHALLPTDPDRLAIERAYLKFVAASDELPAARRLLRRSDRNVRDLLRSHLTGLVSDGEVDHYVDYLKAVLMGVTSSACDHGWSAARQHRVLDLAMKGLGLLPTDPG